jgi:hypothetical protein
MLNPVNCVWPAVQQYGATAMNSQTKTLSQITHQAIEVLSKEIGIARTIRFLNQFSIGYSNYTEERESLFNDLTLDEILKRMQDI